MLPRASILCYKTCFLCHPLHLTIHRKETVDRSWTEAGSCRSNSKMWIEYTEWNAHLAFHRRQHALLCFAQAHKCWVILAHVLQPLSSIKKRQFFILCYVPHGNEQDLGRQVIGEVVTWFEKHEIWCAGTVDESRFVSTISGVDTRVICLDFCVAVCPWLNKTEMWLYCSGYRITLCKSKQ